MHTQLLNCNCRIPSNVVEVVSFPERENPSMYTQVPNCNSRVPPMLDEVVKFSSERIHSCIRSYRVVIVGKLSATWDNTRVEMGGYQGGRDGRVARHARNPPIAQQRRHEESNRASICA